MAFEKATSTKFYDGMAEALRRDPTTVLRVKAEPGRSATNIRQAMTQRGLYVSISRRQDDQPYISVMVADPPAGIDAPSPTLALPPEVSVGEARRQWRALGLDPDQAGLPADEEAR